MKIPTIGLTSCKRNEPYQQAITSSGGNALLLQPSNDPEKIRRIICEIDGLILSGGGDIDLEFHPESCQPGEERLIEKINGIDRQRDFFELILTRFAIECEKPILSICRGCQVLNVACGGTLYLDIPSQLDTQIAHRQQAERDVSTHVIQVEPDTLLARIIGDGEHWTNSFHHQAVRRPGSALKISAQTKDGVIEAIEDTGKRPILGVQFHPEEMLETSAIARKLFEWIVGTSLDRT